MDRVCRCLRLHARQRNLAFQRRLIRPGAEARPSLAGRSRRRSRAKRDVLAVISLAVFAFGLFVIFVTKGTPVEFFRTGCVLASILAMAWLRRTIAFQNRAD